MKIILMVFVSLLSVSAIACPDLRGTYQCSKDGMDTVTVTMQSSTYLMEHKEAQYTRTISADGKLHKDTDQSYTASCVGEKLNLILNGNYNGILSVVNIFYALDTSKNLEVKGTYKETNSDGEAYEQPVNYVCVRL
jgi:hypothetical protein